LDQEMVYIIFKYFHSDNTFKQDAGLSIGSWYPTVLWYAGQ